MKWYNWVLRIFRRSDTLRITLSPEDRELLEWWSERTNESLPLIVARAAVLSVPVAERRKFANRRSVGKLLEAAYTDLDDFEETAFGGDTTGIMPLLPESDPFVGEVPLAEPVPQTLPKDFPIPGHPCLLIRPGLNPSSNLRDGEAPGTCCAKEQEGRPCHWAAPVAKNCAFFRGKAQRGV